MTCKLYNKHIAYINHCFAESNEIHERFRKSKISASQSYSIQNLPQRFYSILQYLIYLQWFDPGHTGFHEIKLTMFKNLNSKQKYAKSFLDIDKHWEECTPAYSKTGA